MVVNTSSDLYVNQQALISIVSLNIVEGRFNTILTNISISFADNSSLLTFHLTTKWTNVLPLLVHEHKKKRLKLHLILSMSSLYSIYWKKPSLFWLKFLTTDIVPYSTTTLANLFDQRTEFHASEQLPRLTLSPISHYFFEHLLSPTSISDNKI